jgi:hypothetical protein
MRFTRLLAVGLIALGVASPVTRAHAGTHTTELSPPELKIISQPFNVFTAVNARFVLSPNINKFVAADDRLEFLLHRRVASRDSFRSIADGDVIPAVTDSVSFRMSRITRNYAGHFIAVVPIITSDKQGASLSIPLDGVYPLTIRLVDAQTGDIVTSVLTFLNRRDTKLEIPLVPFSTIVSLTGPPSLNADGTSVVTDNSRDAVTRLIDFLTTFRSPVTISIQPEIIASFANSSQPADIALFAKLHELLRGRTIVSTTYVPCDPSLFAAMNLSSEFVAQLKFGEDTLNRLLPGVTIQRQTWIAADNVDAPAMSVLKSAGITSVILLPSAQPQVTSERSLSLLGRAARTGNQMLSVISALSGVTQTKYPQPAGSERLAYKIAAEVLVERDDLLAQANAPIDIKMGIVAPFNDAAESGAVVTATRVLSQSRGFSMNDYGGTVIVNPNTPVVAFRKNNTPLDTSRTSSIRTTRQELDATKSMLTTADIRRETWPSLFALGTSSITAFPGAYITSLRNKMRATRDAVTVTTPRSVTLSSQTGAIRIQVRNDSDQDLTVRVRLTSAKLTLTDPNRIIVLTKGGTTEVNVSATTRASGDIPISIWVSTPEGNQSVVDPITISASVNAIAGFGQLISVLFLLMLFAWWWSNRRSARRERLNATTV